MKVYLSGKMTGLSKKKIWNNFQKIEKYLCKRGITFSVDDGKDFSIMNPAVTYAMRKFDAFSYEDWLHIDFAMIDACDAIVLLPNWEDSMGAKREIAYAYKCGKKVYFPGYDTEEFDPKFKFKFDGEIYNGFFLDEELTAKVALEVEKNDVRKSLENLLDSFCEQKAKSLLG